MAEKLIIPGKYIGSDGEEYTVVMTASDGVTEEKTVIYRKSGDGSFFTLSAEAWRKSFTPAEEAALAEGENAGDSELVRRFTELFSGRRGVCAFYWRNAFGSEGYNYICENYEIVPGCMRGIDNCKNCRGGRLVPFSETVAAKHLDGKLLCGVYPVTAEGLCRFLALELERHAQLAPLAEICRDYDIPAYAERFGNMTRLWIFFDGFVPARAVRALGCSLITAAMEKSPEITFSLYDRLCPHPAELAEGSFGLPVILPLGKQKRRVSVFVDREGEPLARGAMEIYGFRSITRSYLADRLNALGNSGFGKLYGGVRPRLKPLTFPKKLAIGVGADIAVPLRSLTPETRNAMRRMACFKNPPSALEEYGERLPSVAVCFTEDEKYLRLPKGLGTDVEELLKASAADFSVAYEAPEREKPHLNAAYTISGTQREAADELLSRSCGVILGRTGSGKTLVVAELIARARTTALILTADEAARRRWIDNVYRLFGIDAERNGSKVAVKLITDEKIKDKYGLLILADLSRMPMNAEIFRRVNALRPSRVYGITADDKRRDGMWGYIYMLCGDVAYRMG